MSNVFCLCVFLYNEFDNKQPLQRIHNSIVMEPVIIAPDNANAIARKK